MFVYLPDLIKLGIFGLWIGLVCLFKRNFFEKYIFTVSPILFFMCILLYAQIGTTLLESSYYLKTCVFLLMIYAIYLFYGEFSPRNIKMILTCLFFDGFYIAINTLFNLRKIPNISRYLSMSEEKIILYVGKPSSEFVAVGNYTFAYGIVFIGLFFLYMVLSPKPLKQRFLGLVGYFFVFLLLIKMEFTIGILLYFITTVLYVFLLGLNNKKIFLLISIIGIISLIFFFIGIPKVLQEIAEYFPEGIATRLNEIAAILTQELKPRSDLGLRLSLYFDSAKSFIASPLFGCLDKAGIIGGHSTFLDFLGSFGLYTISICVFFIYQFVNVYKKLYGRLRILWVVGAVYFFLLSIINTVFSPRILLYGVLVFPLLLIQESRNETNMYNS